MINKVILDISTDPLYVNSYTTILNKLETGLIQNINKSSSINGFSPNFLLVGYLAAEKIIYCRNFMASEFSASNLAIYHVGKFIGYEVYVDPYMDKDTILIQYDKKSMRDSKLNAILEGSKELEIVEISLVGGI